MENLTKQELEKVFIDVRKAYRLLYHYQKRVLDLVKFIGDELDFKYHGGWVKFSEQCPRNGKGALTNSAWEWLPMYYYQFHYYNNRLATY